MFVTFIRSLMLVAPEGYPGNPLKMLGEIKLQGNHTRRSSRFCNFRLNVRFFEVSKQTKDGKTSRVK